jgi:hypothetical protein
MVSGVISECQDIYAMLTSGCRLASFFCLSVFSGIRIRAYRRLAGTGSSSLND